MNAHAAALLLLLLHLLRTHVVLVRAWDDTIPHKASWVSRTKHTPTISHTQSQTFTRTKQGKTNEENFCTMCYEPGLEAEPDLHCVVFVVFQQSNITTTHKHNHFNTEIRRRSR